MVQGGGVAVWIKDDIAYEQLTILDWGNHEILWSAPEGQAVKRLRTPPSKVLKEQRYMIRKEGIC